MIVLLLCLSMLPTPTMGLRYGKTTSLANVDASFWGGTDSDGSGAAVAIVGDVNGDGFDDFAVGAPGVKVGLNSGAGKIYLFFGKATGWTKDATIENADATFLGEQAGAIAGSTLAPTGDVNGDGYDDFLIGAWAYDTNADATHEGKVYLILGKATGWTRDTSLTSADASWVGYNGHEYAGASIAGTGDVNGDGYDDIVIGAPWWSIGDGKAHVIFGRPGGWANNVLLNNSDVTIWGTGNITLGQSVSDAGDYNDDGYDDIVVGAPMWPPDSPGNPSTGRVYIYMGKATGWKKNLTTNDANHIVEGADTNDKIGATNAGLGDVNGDGIDDLLIGGPDSDTNDPARGLVWLTLGARSGWNPQFITTAYYSSKNYEYLGAGLSTAGDVNGDGLADFIIGARNYGIGTTSGGEAHLVLGDHTWASTGTTPTNATFLGEVNADRVAPVSGGGDINGDGYDDLIIGAPANDEGPGNDAGQTYLVFPDTNLPPSTTTSVKLYSDSAFKTQTNIRGMNETVYVELVGTDGNATRRDIALVRVSSETTNPVGLNLRLMETGLNTGKYRGNFTIRPWSDKDHRCINATPWENITVKSVTDSTKNAIVVLRGTLELFASGPLDKAQEDMEYSVAFSTLKAPSVLWGYNVTPAADWLTWSLGNHTLNGTPNNAHVAIDYTVKVNATCFDVVAGTTFHLLVNNTPPTLGPTTLPVATQGVPYLVDFQSDDEGQGQTKWSLTTTILWAQFNTTTGVLNGTPGYNDIGTRNITVKVDDHHGAVNSTTLKLVVLNVNDRPNMTNLDVKRAYEEQLYSVKYNATDNDLAYGDNLKWTMRTNAGPWLTFKSELSNLSAVLEGTPGNNDTGVFWVNVTVTDMAKGMDSHNFTLTVVNINDPPRITSLPVTKAYINHSWSYQVVATDDDDKTLSYSLNELPLGMVIGKSDGLVKWTPVLGQVGSSQVVVNVSDGRAHVLQTFTVTVKANRAPAILSNPPADAIVGARYEYTPVLQDLDQDPMTMKLDVFPAGMYINATGGKLEWLPAAAQVGDQKVTLNVTDGIDFTLQTFSVKVLLTRNHPPIIPDTPSPSSAAKVGQKYFFRVQASDEDAADVVTYSLDKAPPGMTIDHQSGIITWTPAKGDVGTHNISVSAADGKGGLDILNWTITVQKAPAPKKDLLGTMLPFILLGVIAAVACGVVGYVLVKRRAAARSTISAIDDIFIIYKDGRLITHHTRQLRPDVDDQVLGGMLTAVQSFMKDSFTDGEERNVKEISYGEKKILIEHGSYIFLATVIRGHGTSELHESMKNAVENIEREYGEVLKDWIGETSVLKDAKKWLKALIEED
jgi:hypothetical protein